MTAQVIGGILVSMMAVVTVVAVALEVRYRIGVRRTPPPVDHAYRHARRR